MIRPTGALLGTKWGTLEIRERTLIVFGIRLGLFVPTLDLPERTEGCP